MKRLLDGHVSVAVGVMGKPQIMNQFALRCPRGSHLFPVSDAIDYDVSASKREAQSKDNARLNYWDCSRGGATWIRKFPDRSLRLAWLWARPGRQG